VTNDDSEPGSLQIIFNNSRFLNIVSHGSEVDISVVFQSPTDESADLVAHRATQILFDLETYTGTLNFLCKNIELQVLSLNIFVMQVTK